MKEFKKFKVVTLTIYAVLICDLLFIYQKYKGTFLFVGVSPFEYDKDSVYSFGDRILYLIDPFIVIALVLIIFHFTGKNPGKQLVLKAGYLHIML